MAKDQSLMPDGGTVSVVTGRLDPLVGRGIVGALRETRRFRVLASDLNHAALERAVAEQAPSVAIVPPAVDYAFIVGMKAGQPPTGVIVLTPDPSRLLGTMLLTAGATCLSQNAPTQDLLDAADLVARGDSVFLSADGQRMQRPSPCRARVLTRRQKEVYEQLTKGSSDAEIALELKISVETVRAHVRAVYGKLNLRSRRDLAGISISNLRLDQPWRFLLSVTGTCHTSKSSTWV